MIRLSLQFYVFFSLLKKEDAVLSEQIFIHFCIILLNKIYFILLLIQDLGVGNINYIKYMYVNDFIFVTNKGCNHKTNKNIFTFDLFSKIFLSDIEV